MTLFWVSAFLDLPRAAHTAGLEFWRSVTGNAVSPPRGGRSEFTTLVPPDGDDHLRVQRLDEPGAEPRVHLDLHVTDPAASAGRAVSLGARLVADPGLGYVVLASPAGLTFCLVGQPASRRSAPVAWPGGRSQVDQVCVDVGPTAYDAECAFWAALTAWGPTPTDSPEFRRLDGAGLPLRMLLQRLDDESPPRFHLDLSADDRPAEVDRLVALGARVTGPGRGWTVLADPTGLTFCVTDRAPCDP